MIDRVRTQSENVDRVHDAISELLKLPVSDQDRVLVLLTYAGKKPVSEVELRTEEDAARFRKILRALDLHAHEFGDKRDFLFSRDPELLNHAELAYAPKDQKEQWDAIGTVHGFPRTAIDGKLTFNTLDELPADVLDTPVGRFYDRAVAFALSKEHWREELKTIETWMESVRKLAPEYLEYLISDDWKGLARDSY